LIVMSCDSVSVAVDHPTAGNRRTIAAWTGVVV
jgi:hypothetical protein